MSDISRYVPQGHEALGTILVNALAFVRSSTYLPLLYLDTYPFKQT
jgi:hypothetical protein